MSAWSYVFEVGGEEGRSGGMRGVKVGNEKEVSKDTKNEYQVYVTRLYPEKVDYYRAVNVMIISTANGTNSLN